MQGLDVCTSYPFHFMLVELSVKLSHSALKNKSNKAVSNSHVNCTFLENEQNILENIIHHELSNSVKYCTYH